MTHRVYSHTASYQTGAEKKRAPTGGAREARGHEAQLEARSPYLGEAPEVNSQWGRRI